MRKLASLLALTTATMSLSTHAAVTVNTASFGQMPDGREVKIFTLKNKAGLEAKVTEYGATLTHVFTPDRTGKLADVTHGYDDLKGWLSNTAYLGANVGRFGNRIQGGKFTLDGKTYTLATNNSPGGIPCHLHGGLVGFDKVLWSGKTITQGKAAGVEFTYVSKDGEEGYPGTLTTKITYLLNDQNELIWEATATTDKPTVINLAHHSYWNLSGDPTKSIQDHELMLNADFYLPTDKGMIPTGAVLPVAGTPMDFTTAHPIGARIGEKFEALEFGAGYDHCWVIRSGEGVRLAAKVKDPSTGRVMEVLTNQPGVQLYSGNFLDGAINGKGGVKYARRTAFCLETENFPDAPNKNHFPSAVLRPGQTYKHTLIHRFSAE